MLVNRRPVFGVDFSAGDVMFQTSPADPLAEVIAEVSAPDDSRAGRLVATHVGVVLGRNRVAEALASGFTIGTLEERLAAGNWRRVIWFRRPRGLRVEAVSLMVNACLAWKGTPYDYRGLLRFILPVFHEDAGAFFCSEAVAILLKIAAGQLDLPRAFLALQPCDATPAMLDRFPGLWEE